MHNKLFFAVAGIFLAVAIIVPTVLFILQAQNDIVIIQNPTGHQTGNVTTTPEEVQQSHINTLIMVAIIDVIFLLLFAVTMYYGINHVHPTHAKPE
jgi:hypothetical protein